MHQKQLEEVYIQIRDLRLKGVKMKDLSKQVNLPSSVLSAIYSTVLPTYLEHLNTLSSEEALDFAISQVNNVSKKRLLANINEIHQQLAKFNSYSPPEAMKNHSFILDLDQFAKKTENHTNKYLGTYCSYSLSSTQDALKSEPYMLFQGSDDEIKVLRASVSDKTNEGIAIVSNGHSMYIMLNEYDNTQLALVTIYLQLPFHGYSKLLKGIYTAIDCNRNPLARRIVLVKTSNDCDLELFKQSKGEIISKENLTHEQQLYYNYTCMHSDYIRMCTIPAPKLTEEDLVIEKKILAID